MFGDVSQNQSLNIIVGILVVAVAYLFYLSFHKKSPFGATKIPANTSTQINVGATCDYKVYCNSSFFTCGDTTTTKRPSPYVVTNPKKDGTTVLASADGTAKLGLGFNGALFIISTKGIKFLNENVDANGKYSLNFQSDGNVVLYKTNDNNKVIWASGTNRNPQGICPGEDKLLSSTISSPGYYQYTVTSNGILSEYKV